MATKSTKIVVGSHVRVRIRRPGTWAMGAPEKLNGTTGQVTKIKPDHAFSNENGYLVKFDRPVKGWSVHQREVTAFHFLAEDLEVTS